MHLAAGKSDDEIRKAEEGADLLELTMKRMSGRIHIVNGQLDTMGGNFLDIGRMQERLREQFVRGAIYSTARMSLDALIDAFRAARDIVINFDQSLKNLQAIAQATSSQITVMGDKIREVAKDTKFSAVEISDGMVLLAQAGLKTSEVLNSIEGVADLATGTLTELGEAADVVTTVMKAFNISSTETTRIVDVMANSINASKLTMDKIKTGFNYMASTASLAGVELEETAASMSVLANSGLRASTIGTGLRQVLSKLMDPSNKVKEIFQAYGISLSELNPQMVGFEGSIGNLAKLLYDTEKESVDMAKAFEIFGLRGAQAASVIIDSFVKGEYDRVIENIRQTGSAAEMASVQMEGLGAKIKNLSDVFGETILALSEASGVTTALHTIVDGLRSFLKIFSSLVKDSGFASFILQVGSLTTALYALKAGFSVLKNSIIGFKIAGIIQSFKDLTVAMKEAKTAAARGGVLLNFLSSLKAIGITAVIAGIVVGIKHLAEMNMKAAKAAGVLAEKHKNAAEVLSDYKDKLSEIKDDIDLGNRLASVEILDNQVKKYGNSINNFIEHNKDLARSVAKIGLGELAKEFEALGEISKVDELISRFGEGFSNVDSLPMENVKELLLDIAGITNEEFIDKNLLGKAFDKAEILEINQALEATEERLSRLGTERNNLEEKKERRG